MTRFYLLGLSTAFSRAMFLNGLERRLIGLFIYKS
nr:MAG TPA: hypothetical protein [Caudoviricetes sp.]